jgi:tRNA A37 threonylcarbamoyladenosine dehydratase
MYIVDFDNVSLCALNTQITILSNGGKFKLYTVLNALIFPTPIQPRISFDRAI